MIELEIFYRTTEFYVISAVVAAAVVGYFVMPASVGPVATHLLGGTLSPDSPDAEPAIEVVCRDDRSVTLRRRGVESVGLSGAVSLCVKVKGFDITIEERLTPGLEVHDIPVVAEFTLDFMGAERYHIRYDSETTSSMATLTVNNRPGVAITRPLRR